jgi:beta-glucosidase
VDTKKYDGFPRTANMWHVTPNALKYAAIHLYRRYKLPIYITENGLCNQDVISLDGKVHDPQRIDFIRKYLLALKQAIDEGIEVIGYNYWSIMDNFEWVEGYFYRFGLIYVDYRTGERTLKDSADFYAEVIKTNGENL